MRLDTAREETISTIGGSQKFKMNASAKAFQILSSGIYERKIEAIVRELSCNAYDSHVMAGKVDVPFRLQLPTWKNDNVFAIEDFGVGLSEEEVYNVYTTYFESTKTDSNDVIGALGLGSKTPFSYTDSFTVKARKDGKECVFSAQISASGEPEVVKMYERPWSGENGVEVSVEVADKDTSEFYNCAEKVLSWFAVKPECNRVLDFEFDEEAVKNVRDFGYHLQQKDRWSNTNVKVIMGNVAYDLELHDIKVNSDFSDDDPFYESKEFREEVNKFVDTLESIRADCFFEVAIGDADVAASRETLSLDARTKYNLRKKLHHIFKNFRETTIKKMEGMKNVIDAYQNLTAYERSLVSDVKVNGYSLNDFTGRRGTIRTYVMATEDNPNDPELKRLEGISEDYEITIYGDFSSRWGTKPRSKRGTSVNYSELYKDGAIEVIINDCERKGGLKNAIVEATCLGKYVLVVTDKNTVVTKDLEDLLNYLTFNTYKPRMASSFWDGKLSTNKSTSTGLGSERVKSSVIRIDRTFEYSETIDFSVEDKSKWAYVLNWSGYRKSIEFEVDGKKYLSSYVSKSELRGVLSELDLHGIIFGNGNNSAKIKRILGEDACLVKKISAKANKKAAKHATVLEILGDKEDSRFEIFDGYISMVSAIKNTQVEAKNCSQIVFGQAITPKECRKIENAIQSRIEVFEKSVECLRKSSPLLEKVLHRYNFNSKMVTEVKQFIKMKKGRI